MILKPLRNNVLLSPTESTQESRIGIIISSSVGNEGRVVAVGPEVKELKLGDVVRYDQQSSRKLDSYVMCREADVLCVIEQMKAKLITADGAYRFIAVPRIESSIYVAIMPALGLDVRDYSDKPIAIVKRRYDYISRDIDERTLIYREYVE